MPNITAAGTYTKDDAGFGGLKASFSTTALLFGSGNIGDSCVIEYIDDQGAVQTAATITELPYHENINANIDIQITVTGSPNFNLTVTSGYP